MQTQEDHSHQTQAVNTDSLKVDLVVKQNSCSEKEDSNSETASSKSAKECSLNSETQDVHAIKYKMSKAKERCMAYFRSLHSHLQVLSKADLKGTHVEHGFRREFMSIFGQDVDTFTSTMLLNVDQLQKQLDKDEFQEDGSMAAFWVVNNQFQKFINSKFTLDYDSQMTETYFVEYTGLEVQHFRDTLLQHLDWDADLVDTESIRTDSTVQDDSSRSGNDTDADDADIRPIYDEEPMTEPRLKEIDVLEIMNIELEHSVATLRKENETLKQHYKDLYDSIKITRSKTTEQTTSLLANNAELKAQIQEKVFAIAALKNDLRKLKGNSITHPIFFKLQQTLDVSAGTSINVQKEQSLDLSAGLDDGVAASFQRSRIHKPHAHTQAFKVNHSTAQVDQGSQIKMIQVKEMMQDNDLKNSKSKDKGSKSRSQSMNEQSHYKQDKTITRQSINVKRHIFNVIGGTEEFEERDLNIGGDSLKNDLRKLKGKALVDNDVTKHPSDPEMLKIDVEPITPKLYDKLVQELLINISKTCPSVNNTDGKLIAVTPKNKDKRIGHVMISRVYYVEGLGHNLFSVGQFCDSNFEVAFRQHTYFIRNLEGVDLLTGSRGNSLYTLSLGDMMC
ncbi:hypothetical protein Tco_0139735 [Tanacetum coccineum]